jgi:uncharacterized protein
MWSRRTVLGLLSAASVTPSTWSAEKGNDELKPTKPLRIRTITAGIELSNATHLDRIEGAIALLKQGRSQFTGAGYEVQTVRIATQPLIAGLDAGARDRVLVDLQKIDRILSDSGTIMSIGPLLTHDRHDTQLAAWTSELVRSTRNISFSSVIADGAGVHEQSATTAAEIMAALAVALPDGIGNFRFAAAANIPAGTPFFPVAWHLGARSIALGVESASIVEDAFTRATDRSKAGEVLREFMSQVLAPIEQIGQDLSRRSGCAYLGIDSSPAPMKDRSIAAAIEAFTHAPFGTASTLQACSTITAAIKSLSVKTCGYSGLMLPVLEDPLLAQRAGEGRYGIRDLLLYSSVCGTGLDVVPIPGDTPVATIAALLRDVAALSVRLNKALSARLFLVPGKRAGEIARFDDPVLTDSTILKVD